MKETRSIFLEDILFMDKLEYVARSLSRGTNKVYETYVKEDRNG